MKSEDSHSKSCSHQASVLHRSNYQALLRSDPIGVQTNCIIKPDGNITSFNTLKHDLEPGFKVICLADAS